MGVAASPQVNAMPVIGQLHDIGAEVIGLDEAGTDPPSRKGVSYRVPVTSVSIAPD
jgi:hypothetical protein